MCVCTSACPRSSLPHLRIRNEPLQLSRWCAQSPIHIRNHDSVHQIMPPHLRVQNELLQLSSQSSCYRLLPVRYLHVGGRHVHRAVTIQNEPGSLAPVQPRVSRTSATHQLHASHASVARYPRTSCTPATHQQHAASTSKFCVLHLCSHASVARHPRTSCTPATHQQHASHAPAARPPHISSTLQAHPISASCNRGASNTAHQPCISSTSATHQLHARHPSAAHRKHTQLVCLATEEPATQLKGLNRPTYAKLCGFDTLARYAIPLQPKPEQALRGCGHRTPGPASQIQP